MKAAFRDRHSYHPFWHQTAKLAQVFSVKGVRDTQSAVAQQNPIAMACGG